MSQPLLGRLPREEGKSAVAVTPSAGATPTRPAEVHNIELDAADTNMYGNDLWGDCVFVMIEKDRVISAEALGVAITKLTPSQVIANYCDFTGVHTAPGPGANILTALKWAQNHPERFGGSKLLFYGDVPINDEAMKQAVAEFASVCVGVVVYQSMEYPNRVWYNAPRGANVGGHGIAGGSYTAAANFIKTWGYMASVNANGFGTIDELVVCVWDFQWRALTYERQLACIASYQFVTGKPWTGPAAVPPPTPSPEADMQLLSIPVRVFDGAVPAKTTMALSMAGQWGIPANAIAVVAILRAVAPAASGWVYVGPDQGGAPTTSTLDYNAGMIDDVSPVVLLTAGKLTVYSYRALSRFVIDITGYLTPTA
jgi:hypothetical protein